MNFNSMSPLIIILPVATLVIVGIIYLRKFLHMESSGTQLTKEEIAKEEIESMLTIDQPQEGKTVEDEVGKD